MGFVVIRKVSSKLSLNCCGAELNENYFALNKRKEYQTKACLRRTNERHSLQPVTKLIAQNQLLPI